MKQYFYFFRWFFILIFFVLNFFKHLNSFAQTAKGDTSHVKILLDSCKEQANVQCGINLLKIIQSNLSEVQNEKEKMFYQKAEIKTLRNIGNVYKNSMFDLPKAMEYYQMSRKKSEETGDKLGLAASFLNIGIIYSDLSDYTKALEYQEKSLKMFREIKDEMGIGISLNNLGNTYKNQSNYSKALEYFQNSLAIQQVRKDTFEIMTCYNNIGTIYEKLLNFSKATEYYETGLKYSKTINNTAGIIQSLAGMGNVMLSTDKQKEAEKYYTEVLSLATQSGDLFIQSEVTNSLKDIYEKQGRYKEALAMYDKHIVMRDSIFSQNKSKEIALRDAKYESDKREATMQAVAEEEKQKAKVIIWSVVGGLLLVIAFSGFILRSLRITNKQKKIIEVQKTEVEESKHIIEEKNKDITDSINYAKRIQKAMLPHRKDIWQAFPQSFLLFKPKAVLSGDFYFFHKKNNSSFIAVGDGTGHGIPASLLVMILLNKLEDAVSESSTTSEILSLLNIGVKTTLKQSEGEDSIRDGADIALCKVDTENRILRYAGANRPIWIIRKGEKSVEEIKATKKAIGGFTDDSQHFETHEIQMQEGD
ncbi:MAG: tetratricopeptide repeat protein, partial [Bacteroidetes bacterium]